MNIYSALKFIQIDHEPVNHLQVVITDQNGKPDAGMTYDVLEEYQKILEQPITGVNIAMKKQLIELIYAPMV